MTMYSLIIWPHLLRQKRGHLRLYSRLRIQNLLILIHRLMLQRKKSLHYMQILQHRKVPLNRWKLRQRHRRQQERKKKEEKRKLHRRQNHSLLTIAVILQAMLRQIIVQVYSRRLQDLYGRRYQEELHQIMAIRRIEIQDIKELIQVLQHQGYQAILYMLQREEQ